MHASTIFASLYNNFYLCKFFLNFLSINEFYSILDFTFSQNVASVLPRNTEDTTADVFV